MLISLMKYLNGYLRVIVSGHSPERFLNLCSNRNLLIWKLLPAEDGYEFNISRKAFMELEPILEKTNTHIKIVDKVGLPFFLYRYRKRKLFVLGLFLCLGLLFAMTRFVWDIHIVGAYTYSKEEVTKYIEENYLKIGCLKTQVNCAKMEEELREHYDNIAWISCELVGTRLTIKMKESIRQEDEVESDKPCDIVALKDGTIMSIITRNGTPLVKVGDTVKKGDILISGTVNIYDDAQQVIETDYVGSKGDIYAQTKYSYNNSFPLRFYEKKYTGNEKKYITIKAFRQELTPYIPKISYSSYDTVSEINQMLLGHTYYLPFTMTVNTVREYKPTAKTYNKTEAEERAKELLDKFLKELIEKGVEIVKNNVKITIDGEKVTAKGTIIVKESIGKPRQITYKNGEKTE